MTPEEVIKLHKMPAITLVISGMKQGILVAGTHVVTDFKKAINSFLKSTTKPVISENGMDWYDNHFFIDEFCITFLEWVRYHDCLDANCRAREIRNSLVDYISDKCIEQTMMVVDGLLTNQEYLIHQKIVDLIHIGYTPDKAKLLVQAEMHTMLFDNKDQFFSSLN
jgi:hypothetical protein